METWEVIVKDWFQQKKKQVSGQEVMNHELWYSNVNSIIGAYQPNVTTMSHSRKCRAESVDCKFKLNLNLSARLGRRPQGPHSSPLGTPTILRLQPCEFFAWSYTFRSFSRQNTVTHFALLLLVGGFFPNQPNLSAASEVNQRRLSICHSGYRQIDRLLLESCISWSMRRGYLNQNLGYFLPVLPLSLDQNAFNCLLWQN